MKTLVISIACCFLITTGCGYKPDLPPMAPVSGKVLLDGKPLPRGKVQFVPVSGGATATADIQEDGTYRLSTAKVDGAIVGEHRVGVTAQELPKDEKDTYPPSLIPAQYNNPAGSGVTKTVTEGSNTIDIELSSTGPKQ